MQNKKDPFSTHLCGNVYDKKKSCPNLLYADKPGMVYGTKKLNLYYAYCTAEGKCRSLGCVATFTGNSPKWCPKRKEMDSNEDTRGV